MYALQHHPKQTLRVIPWNGFRRTITAETTAAVSDPCSTGPISGVWVKFRQTSGRRGIRRGRRWVRELLLSCNILDTAAAVLWGAFPRKFSDDCAFPIFCSIQSRRRIHSSFLVSSQPTGSDQQDPDYARVATMPRSLANTQLPPMLLRSCRETRKKWSGFGQRRLTGI